MKKVELDPAAVPDIVPSELILPDSDMNWGPIEAAGVHARTRISGPHVTGPALALWLKYSDPSNSGFVRFDTDEAQHYGNDRFMGQLAWMRNAIVESLPGQTEVGNHMARVIGRVILNSDRHTQWSLPLSLAREERMVGRNGKASSPIDRMGAFTIIGHDVSMNLPAYIERAFEDGIAA